MATHGLDSGYREPVLDRLSLGWPLLFAGPGLADHARVSTYLPTLLVECFAASDEIFH